MCFSTLTIKVIIIIADMANKMTQEAVVQKFALVLFGTGVGRPYHPYFIGHDVKVNVRGQIPRLIISFEGADQRGVRFGWTQTIIRKGHSRMRWGGRFPRPIIAGSSGLDLTGVVMFATAHYDYPELLVQGLEPGNFTTWEQIESLLILPENNIVSTATPTRGCGL